MPKFEIIFMQKIVMKGFQVMFLALVMLLLPMCAAINPIAQEEKTWGEVMKVHDEVMPKMSELNNISKQLKEKSQVIKDEVLQPKIIAAIKDLKKADEGMWEWMHNLKQLKTLRQTKTHDEIITYLSEQLTSIKKVKVDMETSMKQGLELLK